MPYHPPVDVRSLESTWKQADFNRLILRLVVLGAIYALAASYWKWYRRQRKPRQGKARRREAQAATASVDSGSQALPRSSQSSNAKIRARSKDHRAPQKPAASTCHKKLLAGVVVTERERKLKQDSESEEEVVKDVPTSGAVVGGLSLEVDADSTLAASCAAGAVGKRRRARSRSRKRGSSKSQDVAEDTVPRLLQNVGETQDPGIQKVDTLGPAQARSSMPSAPVSQQPSTARASSSRGTSMASGIWTAVPAAHAVKPVLSPTPGPLGPSHGAVAEQGSSARARSIGSPATRAAPSLRSGSSAPAERGLSREPLERVTPTYNPEVGKRRAYSNYRVPRTLRLQEEQPLPAQRNFSMHAVDHEFPSLSVSEGRRSRSSSRQPGAAEADCTAVMKSTLAVGKTADAPTRVSKSSREALLERVFKSLDVNGDGCLDRSEMLQFARLTGFDGSALDWRREFKILCQERGSSLSQGLSEEHFKLMVNDQSEKGCYCQDQELQSILKKLRLASSTTAAHQETPSPPGDAETRKLYQSQNSTMSAAEPPSAQKPTTNASGSSSSSSSAAQAVEDTRSTAQEDGGEGFWCQDTETSGKSNTGQPVSIQGSSALPEEPARAKNRFGKAVPRQVMIAKLFAALDLDGDGCLDIAEMRRFAEFTGFDGDAHVWAEEFRLLCEEHQCETSEGLGLEAFVDLVDDKSGSGCYCKDSELLSLRKKLGSPRQAEAPAAQGKCPVEAKAVVAIPSSRPVPHESQVPIALSDHKRADNTKMPAQDEHLPSSGTGDSKLGDAGAAPKQSNPRSAEASEIDRPARRGRDMQIRGKAVPKRRGPAGAPVNVWAPQLPSSFSHASHRAPSRPRTRVKAAKSEVEIFAQAAKTEEEISTQAPMEQATKTPMEPAHMNDDGASAVGLVAQAVEKVKEPVEVSKSDLKAAIPTPLAAEKTPISDPVKSSALAAAGADDEVQHIHAEDARELKDAPHEFQESGEGGFLFEEFEVSGNDDLGPFVRDDVTTNVEESQGNSAEGFRGHHKEQHSCCNASKEKGNLAINIKEKEDLDENAGDCQELYLNTCAACGETWLLPMDLGDDFSCQDAGKPCGNEASQAAVSTFLLAEASSASPDATVKGAGGTQSRPRVLRQILAEGLGVLDATNLLLSHGLEPLYNGELEDVKQEIRKAAAARSAAARKEAAYSAERANRKRTQRYLDGQLVDLPKGSKFIVESKETAEDKQKTSVSIAIIGSRSKPMKDPSEKKKGPQTRL